MDSKRKPARAELSEANSTEDAIRRALNAKRPAGGWPWAQKRKSPQKKRR